MLWIDIFFVIEILYLYAWKIYFYKKKIFIKLIKTGTFNESYEIMFM